MLPPCTYSTQDLLTWQFVCWSVLERDLVGLDPQTSRLVFLASVSDFDDVVPLSRKLMRKHKRISMFSRLTDAHLYIVKHWVVQFLAHER